MKTLNLIFTLLLINFSITAQEGADTDLWNAIKSNDIEGINAAIAAGADIDNAYEAPVMWSNSFGITNGKKVTPLMFAVMNNHYEATLHLLKKGAKPNKMTNIEQAGAIVLPNSMSYNSCTAKKILAVTALYLAIDQNNAEIVKLLLISKKFNGSQPLTINSIGKCILLGKTAVMDGVKCANCGNQAMINPKKFAQLIGHEEIASLFKKFKKTDWFLAGNPNL